MKLIWKMLWPELKVYWRRMVWVVLFGVAISAMKAVTPELLRRLADAWYKINYIVRVFDNF